MSDELPPLIPINVPTPIVLVQQQAKRKDPNQWVVLVALIFAVIVLLGIGQSSSAREYSNRQMQKSEDNPSAETVDLASAEEAQKFLEGGRGLLMVHAPWCGHCKHMMPAYDEAAKAVREEHGSQAGGVQLLRIDYNVAGRDFLSKHGVAGFPTIFEVKGGTKSPYRGNRSAAALIAAAKTL